MEIKFIQPEVEAIILAHSKQILLGAGEGKEFTIERHYDDYVVTISVPGKEEE